MERERERFGVFCVGVFFCGMNVSLFSFSCVVCFLMFSSGFAHSKESSSSSSSIALLIIICDWNSAKSE